jgi:hypothetical protein
MCFAQATLCLNYATFVTCMERINVEQEVINQFPGKTTYILSACAEQSQFQ